MIEERRDGALPERRLDGHSGAIHLHYWRCHAFVMKVGVTAFDG
ncbi:MAG: hypothetical protein ACKOC1_07845 [Hyphomicrobiales bacterium]